MAGSSTRRAPYEQKAEVLWQRRKALYRLQLVFARFECSHTYYIWAVEPVQAFNLRYGGVVGAMPENRVTPLIHHVDFRRIDAVVGRDVGFGLLRYGDYACGVKASAAEFVVVYAPVYGAVVFREMSENQVVDCYNRGDSGSTDVERQFARETVIQRQTVGFKSVCYAPRAPQRRHPAPESAFRIGECYVVELFDGCQARILTAPRRVDPVSVVGKDGCHLFHE